MDLNADLGESWYAHRIGNDSSLMPLLDSCNVACGFHGGDALTMRRTIELALVHGVNIGAHPSFPDREHFGRRKMLLTAEQIEALVLYQVAALHGMTQAAGGSLTHLKPHGALYHYAAFGPDPKAAAALARVAYAFDKLTIYGPQGSYLEREAGLLGVPFHAEGFADRGYQSYNRLLPRGAAGAVLHELKDCVDQAVRFAGGEVRLQDGSTVPATVQTLCVHGDHRGAVDRARAVREALNDMNV